MTNRVLAVSLLAFVALFMLGCSSEAIGDRYSEPLRVRYGNVRNAQFFEGELPGSRPLTDEEILSDVKPSLPSASLNVSAGVIRSSDTGFNASGATSSTAVAIALRFLDLGTGYWVLPVTGQDPTAPGTYNWSATVDFGSNLEPGTHRLAVVAIDADGHAGSQFAIKLCVTSDIPDNLSACGPGTKPPFTALSLAWDAPVDLDLRVITPDGKVADSKHPSTAPSVDGKFDPTAPGTGLFDRDAGRGCVASAHRRESLVWQDEPTAGTYFVYVSLYDACGQPAVRFDLSLHRRGAVDAEGIQKLEQVYHQPGELLAFDADSGASLGLYVTEFTVQP